MKRLRPSDDDDNTRPQSAPSPSSSKLTVYTSHHGLKHQGHLGSEESRGERPERITALLKALADEFMPRNLLAQRLEPPRVRFRSDSGFASVEDLWRVHSTEYVKRLMDLTPSSIAPTGKRGLAHFSPGHSGVKTSFLSSGSLDAILSAAACVCDAVDDVMRGRTDTAFVVARPPGHHCGRDGVEPLNTEMDLAQGFCFVNNVMVGAARAAALHSCRVAVFDFDLHHGNGSEGIVRNLLHDHLAASHPTDTFPLLLASVHQYHRNAAGDSFFPGTGEVVADDDVAAVINAPLPPHSGSAELRAALMGTIIPRLRAFAPDIILLSAGFDSHRDDDVGDLNFVDDDYEFIAAQMASIQPRVVSVLEGGYQLVAPDGSGPGSLLRASVSHVRGLMSPK